MRDVGGLEKNGQRRGQAGWVELCWLRWWWRVSGSFGYAQDDGFRGGLGENKQRQEQRQQQRQVQVQERRGEPSAERVRLRRGL